MKMFWELLLKLSIKATSKLYDSDVSQVDIHLKNGNKLMIMGRVESERLKRCTELLNKWEGVDITELKKQIDKLNRGATNG